jgi:hypothetical protein
MRAMREKHERGGLCKLPGKLSRYFPEEIEEVFCYFLLLSDHFFIISSSLKFVFYLDFVIPPVLSSISIYPFRRFLWFISISYYWANFFISLSLIEPFGLDFFSFLSTCIAPFNLETQERKAVEFNSTLIAVLSKDFRRLWFEFRTNSCRFFMWCDAFLNSLAIRSFHFLKRGYHWNKVRGRTNLHKKNGGGKKITFPPPQIDRSFWIHSHGDSLIRVNSQYYLPSVPLPPPTPFPHFLKTKFL